MPRTRYYTATFTKAGGVFAGAVPSTAPVLDPASGTVDALNLAGAYGWHWEVVLNQSALFLGGDEQGVFVVYYYDTALARWMETPPLEGANEAAATSTGLASGDYPVYSSHLTGAIRIVPKAVTSSGADGTTMTVKVVAKLGPEVR